MLQTHSHSHILIMKNHIKTEILKKYMKIMRIFQARETEMKKLEASKNHLDSL